jgi:hypothetical protein
VTGTILVTIPGSDGHIAARSHRLGCSGSHRNSSVAAATVYLTHEETKEGNDAEKLHCRSLVIHGSQTRPSWSSSFSVSVAENIFVITLPAH